MCTIAILFGVAEVPLVLAANRDELYARPTLPPQRLAPGVAGGVDVQNGGTWLAVHRDGRFVAVTNQRVLAQPPPGLRSRGLVVREMASVGDPDAYVAALDPRAYASMNLVWGDAEHVSIAYLRREEGTCEIVQLPKGIHALCNDRLRAPGFPRCSRVTSAIESALAASRAWPELSARLPAILGDHEKVPLAEVPPSHLPVEIAREMTASCIHTEHYGTRSATLVAIDHGKTVAYRHADGPPCTTPFVDRMELLS